MFGHLLIDLTAKGRAESLLSIWFPGVSKVVDAI